MTIKKLLSLALIASATLANACKPAEPAVAADTIYAGGDIVTVNDSQPTVEALAVKDGKILAVGTRADITRSYQGSKTVVVDLAGKTLMPGFIDPHSHYINSLSVANQVNVYAPPAGPGKDPAAIVAQLKKFRDDHKIAKGVMIMGYGYDENAMPNGQALTRWD